IRARHRVSEELELDRIVDECPRLQLHEAAVTGGWRGELFVEPGVEAGVKVVGDEVQNAIGLGDGRPKSRLVEEARGVGEMAPGTIAHVALPIVNNEEPPANLAVREVGGVDVGVHLAALQTIDQILDSQTAGRLEDPQRVRYRAKRHIQVKENRRVIAW